MPCEICLLCSYGSLQLAVDRLGGDPERNSTHITKNDDNNYENNYKNNYNKYKNKDNDTNNNYNNNDINDLMIIKKMIQQ